MEHHSPYQLSVQVSDQDSRGPPPPTSTHQESSILSQGNGHHLDYDQALKQAQDPPQGSPMSPDSPQDVQPEMVRQPARSSESLVRSQAVKVSQAPVATTYPSPLLPTRYPSYLMETPETLSPTTNSHRRDLVTHMSPESPIGVHHGSPDRTLRVDGGQSHELHHILPFLQGRLPPPGYLFSKQPTGIPHHQNVTEGHFSPESPSEGHHDAANGGQSSSGMHLIPSYMSSSMSSVYPPGLMFPKQIVSQPQTTSPGQISQESSSPDLDQKFGSQPAVELLDGKLSQATTFSVSSSHPPPHYMFSKHTVTNPHQQALQDLVSHEMPSDAPLQIRQNVQVERSQSHLGLPLHQPAIAHAHAPDFVVDASRQMGSPHQQFFSGTKVQDRQTTAADILPSRTSVGSLFQPTTTSLPSGFPAGYILPGPKDAPPDQVLNLSAETSQGGIRHEQLERSDDTDLNTLSDIHPYPTSVSREYHPGLLQDGSGESTHHYEHRGESVSQSHGAPGGQRITHHKANLSRSLDAREIQPTDLSHFHVGTDNYDVATEARGRSSLSSSGDSYELVQSKDTSENAAVGVLRGSLTHSEHAHTNTRDAETLDGARDGREHAQLASQAQDTSEFRGEGPNNDMDEEESGSSESEGHAGTVDKETARQLPEGGESTGDHTVTPWEQIVDVAATRREQAIENGPRGTVRTLVNMDSGDSNLIGRSHENPISGQSASAGHQTEARSSDVGAATMGDEGSAVLAAHAPHCASKDTQASTPPRMQVRLTVDERWQETMIQCGFNGEHSRFAEFLLSFYKSHKKCSEMTPGGSKDSGYEDSGVTGSAGGQTQACCGCTCHTEGQNGNPTDQSHDSSEYHLSAAAVERHPEEATTGNRRKTRQQKPRKRKAEAETFLPYSQVPIYKTKAKRQQSPEPVGVVSFSEEEEEEAEESVESGLEDHTSDTDFKPTDAQSDSADDDLPLKIRRTRLRKRSAAASSKAPKSSYEYVLQSNNPSAPLKIKLKQMARRDADQANAARNRKPRKPAKPKKVRAPKRATRAVKAKAAPRKEGPTTGSKRGRRASQPKPKPPPRPTPPGGPRLRRKRGENPIVKVSWSELLRQYMCKLCLCESPCLVDITLHLFDCHMDAIGAFTECLANLEITVGSRTATAFEFLAGRRFEDRPSKEEEPEIPKKLPPVSGILSSFIASQEGVENRATSEIVMSALSQGVPPVSNAMAFLHGASPATVFNALSATGALPYLPSLAHSATLGDGSLSNLHGGGNIPSGIGRIGGQDGGHQLPPPPPVSADAAVAMMNAAVQSSQTINSVSSAETETTVSTDNPTNNRQRFPEGFGNDVLLPFLQAQVEQRSAYLNRFRKSGVDVEGLSKALEEADVVFRVIESWVKIRHTCPRCHKAIRVSKRSNKHRCRGSEDKPIYVLCDVCGNNYQKEYFSLHYNRIHCQSLIPCHVCGKKFTPSSLPKHVYKHSNPPTAFKCGSCPKSFRFRMDLERHELVHRVDKPYLCPTCGRGFTQKSNMQYHMRQHTGEQPYKCDNCMKSFTHNVSLKNHLKKHHGIDLWAMGYTGGGRPKKEPASAGTGSMAGLPTMAPPI